jgi:DNA excision repair protein ERCC-3
VERERYKKMGKRTAEEEDEEEEKKKKKKITEQEAAIASNHNTTSLKVTFKKKPAAAVVQEDVSSSSSFEDSDGDDDVDDVEEEKRQREMKKKPLMFKMKKTQFADRLKKEEEDDDDDDDDDDEYDEMEKKKRKKKPSAGDKKKMAQAKKKTKKDDVIVKRENDDSDDDDSDDSDDDNDSQSEDEKATNSLWEGGTGFGENDFSDLDLKVDHPNRPLWVCSDGRIFLESFSPLYKAAYDFLIAVAEPVCRPEHIHEYVLTPHSLYAAVSIGLTTEKIAEVLDRLSKTNLSSDVKMFITACTKNYGKVKLVLKKNKFFLESPDVKILEKLLKDDVVRSARVVNPNAQNRTEANAFETSFGLKEVGAEKLTDQINKETELQQNQQNAATTANGGEKEKDNKKTDNKQTEDELIEIMKNKPEYDPSRSIHSFEIKPLDVEKVKQRCLPGNLGFPALEEYDFVNDTVNPNLNVRLKPMTKIRPYQEKSLSKMFGNGRARSGIIVLPCGAGKSLTGIAAAVRVGKSCLCLCTSSVSVDQWAGQFKLWTNLTDREIVRFTSQNKETFPPDNLPCVCVTTYNMISAGGKRSEASAKILDAIRGREWGTMLLDEVHVVPAAMFRKVIGITKAHCKLGLTATLVREDDKVEHLNFLIGPKLYEANWLDLQRDGHIANVQCVEVWCEMTPEFFAKYLDPKFSMKKQVLYCMNPNKFMACQYLMTYHENFRKDKVIVFSDNIFALREYATALKRPLIYGDTSHAERTRVLHAFKYSNEINTIFLSKVGDNSIDIPEANVIIQISSHAGSRRQEAQRLGRILRPKAATVGKKNESEDHNAFFYSLVSRDTSEMYYSTKRQQFLIQQGYAFKIVPDLIGENDKIQLMYSTKEAQIDLLAKTLNAGEAEAGEEVLDVDEDDLEGNLMKQKKAKLSALALAKRTRTVGGSLAKLSGAQGLTYQEFASSDAGKPRTGFSSKSSKTSSAKPKNSILREREAMLKGSKKR